MSIERIWHWPPRSEADKEVLYDEDGIQYWPPRPYNIITEEYVNNFWPDFPLTTDETKTPPAG